MRPSADPFVRPRSQTVSCTATIMLRVTETSLGHHGEPAARRRRARSSAKRVSCSSRVRCSSCSRRTAGGRNFIVGGQEALRGSIGIGLAAAGGGVTAVNATRIASGLAATSCAGELRRNGEDAPAPHKLAWYNRGAALLVRRKLGATRFGSVQTKYVDATRPHFRKKIAKQEKEAAAIAANLAAGLTADGRAK